MAQVIFNYEGINTVIQCDINEKMKDIINRFMIKINNKENNLYYFYNDKRINIDATFNDQANDIDKIRKKMNIIAIKDKEYKNKIKDIISKDIICPVCKENR